MAAYPPADTPPTSPKASRNIKEALTRLETETDKLLEEIKGELPFHDTLRDITDRMR